MIAPFLAVDWGTTRVRAWRVAADGSVEANEIFPLGVSRLAPGEAAARFADTIRPALGAQDLPAILCGMIGSNLGWTPVRYLDCPVDLAALAQALHPAPGDPSAMIVPGLRGPGVAGAPDVMRGEETQVLGWLAGDPARRAGEHRLCLPGTHAKWVRVQDGRVVRFLTAMTGEVYDLLARQSVLRSDAPADDAGAFLAGVDAAGDGGGLLSRLFSVRARVVGADAPAAETPSFLSGLLIGADAAGAAQLLETPPDAPVELIGEPGLCRWYETALARQGRPSRRHDGGAAALAGLIALQRSRA